ncbi:MAG: glycosylhydrolase-like jelly roll fold domain-containing protein, partial [Chitinophaga rupis]
SATLPVNGPWQISFDTAWGGPAQIQTDTLQSSTEFKDTGIKYYSGTAVYRKSFTVGGGYLKGSKAVLDLGNVLEMASITLNGHKMPVRWCAPFQFDITSYIHAGDNQLEVEVVNLWANRLIGDSRLPQGQRRTKTNIKKFDEPGSEKYLRVSGLLGPVMVRFYPMGSVR